MRRSCNVIVTAHVLPARRFGIAQHHVRGIPRCRKLLATPASGSCRALHGAAAAHSRIVPSIPGKPPQAHHARANGDLNRIGRASPIPLVSARRWRAGPPTCLVGEQLRRLSRTILRVALCRSIRMCVRANRNTPAAIGLG